MPPTSNTEQWLIFYLRDVKQKPFYLNKNPKSRK